MTRRRRIPYSEAELQFIADRGAMNRTKLHAAFVQEFGRADVTLDHIKSLCSRRGWATRRRWTDAEDAVLRELYPNTKTEKIAAELGHTLSSTYQRAKKLGLEKSAEYLASADACRLRRGDQVGAPYRFKKGQTPANKGLRRPGWSPGRMRETQFTKGQAGYNWKPIGSERLIDGYHYTKVADLRKVPWTRNWKPTHVLNWTEANGPLQPGFALKCLDGNRLNVEASNWIAIPRAMLPRLSGRHRRAYDTAPAELKPAILAVAKLEHAAAELDGLTPVQRMAKKRKARAQAMREAGHAHA